MIRITLSKETFMKCYSKAVDKHSKNPKLSSVENILIGEAGEVAANKILNEKFNIDGEFFQDKIRQTDSGRVDVKTTTYNPPEMHIRPRQLKTDISHLILMRCERETSRSPLEAVDQKNLRTFTMYGWIDMETARKHMVSKINRKGEQYYTVDEKYLNKNFGQDFIDMIQSYCIDYSKLTQSSPPVNSPTSSKQICSEKVVKKPKKHVKSAKRTENKQVKMESFKLSSYEKKMILKIGKDREIVVSYFA